MPRFDQDTIQREMRLLGAPATRPEDGRVRRLGLRWLLLGLVALAGSAGAQQMQSPRTDRPQGVRYVYLIRHGMYDRDTTVDDRVGDHLNALGREQARLIGQRLAKLPVKFGSLVSSDFTRARETADIIGEALRMTPARDSLLHECGPTSERTATASPRSQMASAACDSNLAAAWATYMRASPERDAHDVLVCHGNVTRWWVARTLGGDTRRWPMMDIANASLTIVAVRADGTTRLVMFSDVGHLPLDRQTWTGRGAGWGGEARR